MESIKEEIHPIIFIPELPEAFVATPVCRKKKSKPTQSRYEDIWSEDVHAAFMEAIDIFPSMGKQRAKHVSISQGDQYGGVGSSRTAKSLGRCQLIQTYILEKTGKNRNRKQVSSHIQRMKKVFKDEPTKRPLFRKRRLRLTQEHPDREPEAPASSPEGTQSTDTVPSMSLSPGHASPSDDMSPIVQCAFEELNTVATVANGSCLTTCLADHGRRSTILEHQEVFKSIVGPRSLPPSSTGATMEGDPASTGSAFSLSSLHSLAIDSHESTGVYSPQGHWSSGYQVPHTIDVRNDSSFTMMDYPGNYSLGPVDRVVARDYSDFTMTDSPCSHPLTPADQVLHTPLQPPQIWRFEQRKVVPENFDGSCHWPLYADTSGSLLDSDSYTSHTYTGGIGLAQAPEPLLSTSDMHSSPFYMNYMSDLLLEHERRYHARILPCSHAYDTSIPYTPDLSAPELARLDSRLFHHPHGHVEEHHASPLVKPTPLYPAVYAHTEKL